MCTRVNAVVLGLPLRRGSAGGRAVQRAVQRENVFLRVRISQSPRKAAHLDGHPARRRCSLHFRLLSAFYFVSTFPFITNCFLLPRSLKLAKFILFKSYRFSVHERQLVLNCEWNEIDSQQLGHHGREHVRVHDGPADQLRQIQQSHSLVSLSIFAFAFYLIFISRSFL